MTSSKKVSEERVRLFTLVKVREGQYAGLYRAMTLEVPASALSKAKSLTTDDHQMVCLAKIDEALAHYLVDEDCRVKP